MTEDLYIIALVRRWNKERSRGNPFKERYVEAYTKIRGRTCESLRDRQKRFLKYLTEDNIKDLRKALHELGPDSYIHFAKSEADKNVKVYKGVFPEPASVQNSMKNPEIQEKHKRSLKDKKKDGQSSGAKDSEEKAARLER